MGIQQNISFRSGHISDEGDAHGHSHDVAIPVEESIQATARGFLVVLALSIHDFFEGIALGVGLPDRKYITPLLTVKVSRTTSSVYFLLLAFATHKWVISGTMGLNWARSKILPIVALLYMTVFCGISPVGVAVGMAIKEVIQVPPSMFCTRLARTMEATPLWFSKGWRLAPSFTLSSLKSWKRSERGRSRVSFR